MHEYKRARVLSDGTPSNTKIFDSKGNEIHGASSVKFTINAGDEFGEMEIVFTNVKADITGNIQDEHDDYEAHF